MSYFSDIEYKIKNNPKELWFERLYFNRWFKDMTGPILDIGCATGNFISVRPEIIEGIEIDEDCYKIAQERGFTVQRLDVDSELNKMEADKYQGVYVKHVIEHLQDPLNFLKEIKRILKPGGRAVILTPNCPYMLNKNFWDDYTHLRPFTKKSLEMITYDAGFSDIKVYEDFRCFVGLGRLMRWLNLSPNQIRKIQALLGIRGLSLILEIIK